MVSKMLIDAHIAEEDETVLLYWFVLMVQHQVRNDKSVNHDKVYYFLSIPQVCFAAGGSVTPN